MVKTRTKLQYNTLTKKQKAIILPLMGVIVIAALAIGIYTIVIVPPAKSNPTAGVAANGFTAFVEKDTDLGIGKLVTKDQVVTALGNKAKKVSNVDISSVFNYAGDRGQTATYNFVRADGKAASLYIDMTVFPNQSTMDKEDILAETAVAKIIDGHTAYYMHAQTLGPSREYRLLVINGLKAYKFVIDQPVNNVTLSEVSAVASLIKLAEVAKF